MAIKLSRWDDGLTQASVPPTAYGHLLVVYVVWGSAYLAVKASLSGPALITPLQFQTARMWCAALLLAAVTALGSGGPGIIRLRDIGLSALTGVLMWVAGNGLVTLASKHAASSFIVMAMGAIPLWGALLDFLIRRSMPERRVLSALTLGLIGLALVVGPALVGGHRAAVDPDHAFSTVLMLLGAGATWALGTILQRPLVGRVPPGWSATFQMLAAAMFLTGPTIWEGAPIPVSPSLIQLAGFGFLVVFGSVICLTSYIKVVRTFTPQTASTFAYVNPVIGVLLGWALLSEQPSPVSLVGMAVILVSIAIILTTPASGRPS